MVHLPRKKLFWEKLIISHIHLPTGPFYRAKFKKNSFSRSRLTRTHNFGAKNGPFAQMRISFRKPVDRPCFFPSCLCTCQKSKSDNNLLMKYRRLKNTEISLTKSHFLAITWDPDFSEAFSFHRMLMNHENFRFTQIPDKTNDAIFLKSPKTPNTMLNFRKN